jgi:hypothetical protein
MSLPIAKRESAVGTCRDGGRPCNRWSGPSLSTVGVDSNKYELTGNDDGTVSIALAGLCGCGVGGWYVGNG